MYNHMLLACWEMGFQKYWRLQQICACFDNYNPYSTFYSYKAKEDKIMYNEWNIKFEE